VGPGGGFAIGGVVGKAAVEDADAGASPDHRRLPSAGISALLGPMDTEEMGCGVLLEVAGDSGGV
jgi:hypothetical protein